MPRSKNTQDTPSESEKPGRTQRSRSSEPLNRSDSDSKKTTKKTAKKAATKKAATKKAVTKKATTKKATTKKATTKKAVAKKATAKKTTAKKTTAKKTTTKKTTTKKTTAKKTTAKKTASKKAVTKKATTKKTATRKTEDKEVLTKKTDDKRADDKKSKDKKASRTPEKTTKKRGDKSDEAKESTKRSGKKKQGKSRSSDDREKKESKPGKQKSSERGRSRRSGRRHGDALPEAESGPTPENRIMLVNEIPGEECRIALLENGRLDEYFVERASSATVVGNIYKARVTNIEPAIQAAFVDFGLGESGFLHVSDLHPKYFPGSDLVEQVGKKIPRKQRPPIQDALKKGQEILVQVLKQGIGTKGPTVTSYLSIPGRLMVMMPDMDRIGVSRKVADDNQRKKMRTILDSLDLPEKFGFIVRTAGFESSKMELKRDVAYLKRLWDQMDRRIQNTGAPCLLYAESDILIRTIRDVLDSSIKTIVSDHPEAFERASNFLKVSGISNGPEIRYYDRNMPLFSAFGVERQIASLHLQEVPLTSGGALVIEQTEALVAIDVNSGRSRSAKDSETNAYETNKEAVDEICRQLRLRDLGGLIVNDLIDMRHQKHREEIERRIMRNFKRDRAKSTVLPISEFGIVEMTRQRMRPNTKKANFELCPTCEGTGEAPRPDSVAADALRRAAVVLENESVRRIELVCSRKIAAILSGDKKKEIERFEERSSRKIDIQISDKIVDKRVDIYAYDETGADVEVSKNLSHKVPKISDLPMEIDPDDPRNKKTGGKRRRRRGRGKTAPADATAIALAGGFDIDEEIEAVDDEGGDEKKSESDGDKKKKKRRRRRGRGRGRAAREAAQREEDSKSIRIYALAKELDTTSKEILARCSAADGYEELKNHMSSLEGEPLLVVRGWFAPPDAEAEETDGDTETNSDTPANGEGGDEDNPQKRKRRRRRGRRGRKRDDSVTSEESTEGGRSVTTDPENEESAREETLVSKDAEDSTESSEEEDRPRKRRRRRRGRRRKNSDSENEQQDTSESSEQSTSTSADESDERSEENRRESGESEEGGEGKKRKRRRRRSRKNRDGDSPNTSPETSSSPTAEPPPPPAPTAKTEAESKPAAAPKPKRRSLYGGRMRRVT